MAELYVLNWQDTAYGLKPTAEDVTWWLEHEGYQSVSVPKVYSDGSVQIELEDGHGITARWPDFTPVIQTVEDKLSGHVKALLEARADVLQTPEARRTATEKLLLAVTALVLYGYGIIE